jgi:hypothetical protein
MSTSGQVNPEMQSESRSREDCNPKRDVGMQDFSTALPIGRQRSNLFESLLSNQWLTFVTVMSEGVQMCTEKL